MFASVLGAQLLLPVQAAVVNLATAPLYTTTTSSVKPNLLFVLDDSGSMTDDFLPDDVPGCPISGSCSATSSVGYWSAQCNGVAYDPATVYTLPVDSSGAPKSAPTFNSAWSDGFAASGANNLSSRYYYMYKGSQPALTYTYNSSGVITTSPFYKECNAATTSSPTSAFAVTGSVATIVSGITVNGVQILSSGNTSATSANVAATVAGYIVTKINAATATTGFSAGAQSAGAFTITGPASAATYVPIVTCTVMPCKMTLSGTAFTPFVKVAVTSTSGPGGSDERQNYANWFSYYKTRLGMMKTGAGLAFKPITSNFRVGFTTISYNGATDGSKFLHIDDFISGTLALPAQKDKFYSTLYAVAGSGSTPLRSALSKAGRIFAGKLGADPMQYSCQQNFTILSTDGYWNTGSETSSYGPFGLNNSTPVGQQDGGATPRPMLDGETTVVTQRTPISKSAVVTTPTTVITPWSASVTTSTSSTRTRTDTFTQTAVTYAKGSCTGTKQQPTTTTYTAATLETETSGTASVQPRSASSTTVSNAIASTASTQTHTVVTTNGVVTSDTSSNWVNTVTASSTPVSGPSALVWSNSGSATLSAVPAVPVSTYAKTLTIAGMAPWTLATTSAAGACVSTPIPANTASISASPTSTTAWSGYTTSNPAPVTSAASPGTPQTTTTAPSEVDAGPTAATTTTTTVINPGPPNTLADIAMYYYQTDLRHSGSPNTCTSGSSGQNLCPLDSSGAYSPNVPGNGVDNNVAPHMTTFTLGLGVNGLLTYSPTYATDNSGDFYAIRTGSANWPDPDTSATSPYGNTSNTVVERIDDLWHAAVNGRGTYFSAKNPTALVTSLNSALAGMSTRLGYGTSAATSNLAPIIGDNSLYVASYTTAQWTGNLVAESINVDTGTVNQSGSWCAADVAIDVANGIPACIGQLALQISAASDTRSIYFNKSGTLANFTYANLGATLQAYFDPSRLSQWSSTFSATDKTTATRTTLVDFLRGQTQYESQSGNATILYRDRKAALGDIVDNQPVFLSKPIFSFTDPGYNAWENAPARQNRAATVFVGANDGMLHAFNAATGVERWAFVPTMVMPNMYWLADLTYTTNHHNYVNGHLVYSDVCVANCADAATADWRTILIGSLNGGGRGYYALDVTDPAAPKMLWEFSSLNDADLGYSFGNPLAVKKHDGTWVIVFSSGYDNVQLGNGNPYDGAGSGKEFLFVLNPLTGALIDKIGTTVGSTGSPGGLGKISFWADNPDLDASALNVYGGDLLGNLWRFDINTGAVLKLATLTDASSNVQPVTTRPELAKVNGSRVVYVSTGKYLEATDLDSTGFKTQSVYAMVDNGVTLASPRTALVQQTLVNAKPNRTVSNNAVNIPLDKGWFVDLPDSGERSNVDMILAQGTLLVPSNVPTNGVCEAGGYSWLNFFNYKSGSYVPGASSTASWSGNDLTTGINLVWIKGHPVVIRTGSGTAPKVLAGAPFNPGGAAGVAGHRVSWREIIQK